MTNARAGRVPQRRIAETVAAELRTRILNGDDEYRLPTQDQLVQDFGVSYPSIREALRILETEGLVTVRRGNIGGAEVHRPDAASAAYHLGLALQGARVTLGDLAAGLRALEPLCAGECAARTDRATTVVPALIDNVDRSAALLGDGVAFTHTAREFHDLIVSYTPNLTVRYVVATLVTLWSAQEQAWAETLTREGHYPSRDEAEAVVRTHRRIVQEIEAGRGAEAQRLYRTHLSAAQAVVLDQTDDGIVSAAAAGARLALQSVTRARI
ncbi:FadR/GntR family transcriptional regulator [Skermania piniformis]|uniref:GntR family transcriptional regulator n=1 Tax=Skermania pinensis TaxID=39122 RepID=A0ABX8SFA8_9ACTN|nr:GntR family transcriptional regulator [Skermania piniformis]QXQ15290.1 GntR family transcriptional regulator [Skermania piniformis]